MAGSRRHRLWQAAGWAALVLGVGLVAFAFVDTATVELGGNRYAVSMIRLNRALAFGVAILGLQVVVGYTGQVALGQSAFVGTGAFLTAWLVADHSWPYLATLAVVVPVCFVLGTVVGLPALRIRGLYLALVTFGFAAVFPSLVRLDALEARTGGSNGKSTSGAKLVSPDWLPLDGVAEALQSLPAIGGWFGDGPLPDRLEDRMWRFVLLALMASACFWVVANLVRSRPGRAMRAVRDNELAAAVAGIDVARTKTAAFGVASAIGGVAGTMYVMEAGIASPDDFTQLLAINLIVGLVVGGAGTLPGAIIGGLVVAFVPEWASGTESVAGVPDRWLEGPTGSLVLGAGLIALTFVLPGGAVAGIRTLRDRLVRVVAVGPEPTRSPLPAAAERSTRHRRS